MKLFEVEITTRAIIACENEHMARAVAYDNRREMVADDCDVEILNETVEGASLPAGWDIDNLPYGNHLVLKTIKEILEEQ